MWKIFTETLTKDMKMICDFSNIANSNNFYYIKNPGERYWVLPCSSSMGLKAAHAIYQPLTVKGTGFKCLFPYFASYKVFQKLTKVEIVKIGFRMEFLDWVDKVFETRDPLFSFFLGTPGVYRKTIVQVSDKNFNILGYIKFTSDLKIAELIKNEADFLTYLSDKELAAPKLLGYEKDFLTGLTMMAQTTKKTLKACSTSVLNQKHFDFQRQLYEKTKVTMKYGNTQYFKNQQKYLHVLKGWKKIENKRVITSAIDKINQKLKNSAVTFSAAHRDFTYTNICFIDSKIFVFDWEYAVHEYPPFYDLFCFIAHIILQNDRISVDKAFNEIETLIKIIQKQCKGFDMDSIKLYSLMFLTDAIFVWLIRGLEKHLQCCVDLIEKVSGTI